MIVHVTQEHIDNGLSGDPGSCALALAIDAATGLGSLVRTDVIYLYGGGALCELRGIAGHTEQTARFMHEFDAGRPVEPFEFELTWEAA